MNKDELETVELEKDILLGEALQRLSKNPDFKTVILDHVIDERNKNFCRLLAHEGTTNQGNRPRVMEELVAISNLQYELERIKHFHEIAIQDTTDEDLLEGDAEE